MTGSSEEPRILDFHEYQDILDEAQRLESTGYRSIRNWNLAQTCSHLSDWMGFPIDGYPPQNVFARMMVGVMRMTIGKRLGRKMIEEQRMKPGNPTFRETIAPPDVELDTQLQRLAEAVERCRNYHGPFDPSPIFGPLNEEEWKRLHLAHAQLHMGFLLPKDSSSESTSS